MLCCLVYLYQRLFCINVRYISSVNWLKKCKMLVHSSVYCSITFPGGINQLRHDNIVRHSLIRNHSSAKYLSLCADLHNALQKSTWQRRGYYNLSDNSLCLGFASSFTLRSCKLTVGNIFGVYYAGNASHCSRLKPESTDSPLHEDSDSKVVSII